MRPTCLRAAAAIAAAALLAACRDEKPVQPVNLPAQPRTGTAAPPKEEAPRAQQPLETALPEAAALSADGARRALLDAVEAAPDATVVREALLAFAATSDLAAVRAATAPLLAKGEDIGFADSEAAAVALEALLVAGDESAEARAVALAEAGLRDEVVWDAYAPMLAAVRGPRMADARKLLVQMAADDFSGSAAVAALVPLREPSAADRFFAVATDAENVAADRCAAAVGLHLLGDPRAKQVTDDVVHAATTLFAPFEAIDGFGIPGVPEALDFARRVADPVLKDEDNVAAELANLAATWVDCRGAGKGTPEDLAYLRSLLGREDGLSDEEIVVALWSLGDDAQAAAAANVLAKYVTGVALHHYDEELGVRILSALAVRGGADKRPFGKAVDAAAAVPIPSDPKRPDMAARAWRLRVAAARAFLASARR